MNSTHTAPPGGSLCTGRCDSGGPCQPGGCIDPTERLPRVAGRCPACGGSALYLADGGHIACDWPGCSNPRAVDSQLNGSFPDRMVRVELPYQRPPLSLNDGNRNPHKSSSDRKKVRHDVGFVFRSRPYRQMLGGPHDRLTVQLHYRPRVNRNRDTDNLAATEKPIFDALTDAGVVVDDNTRHLTRRTPEIHPVEPGKPGAVWLTVEIPHV